MTAGAPLGSFIAARLFHAAFAPQVILQIAAVLLAISAALYLGINRRESRRTAEPRPMESAAGGFRLVLRNRYLLLVALLIVLLNLVNTTGEYLVARLLTLHVGSLAAANPGFNKQAYIGAFSGDYQFWVNVTAFVLQAFVTSRAVKYAGLAGALLALPLIALGRLRDHLGGRQLLGRALDQDGGERHRLLDHEHRAPAALAADQPRREVQSEAGDRRLLHARRRRALGRGGLCRRQRPAPQRPAVRHREHGDGARLDRRRARDSAARAWRRAGRRCGSARSVPPRQSR
jgi:hypothetical protein